MATEQDAMASVVQLSTFTKVTSTIPREDKYSDFPVTVSVKAPAMTLHDHAPVDIVAVIDVSESMGWDAQGTGRTRLELVKDAVATVVKNLAGAQNRLAVVPFNHFVQLTNIPLVAMTDEGQESTLSTVNSLKPWGQTEFSPALDEAIKILDARVGADKNRLAFIIFLSDGDAEFDKESIEPTYPIHAFGFSADHNPDALQAMADRTSGSYTAINDQLGKITEKLDQLSDKLTSVVAVDTRITLESLHQGVSLSRVEASPSDDAGDSYKSQISNDNKSGEIFLGAASSGKEREFTVYLDVPEGDRGGATMKLLSVGGSYKQSWDQKVVALGESVVTVERPWTRSSICGCKELEWIEQRVEYWCKAKQDLSAMYDKVEAEAEAGVEAPTAGGNDDGCKCQVTAALREESMAAIDAAMHHDVFTAVLHVLKLRRSGTGDAVPTATKAA